MLVSLDVLATQLLTISALTKVIVEMIKVYLPGYAPNSAVKWTWSIVIPVVLCVVTGVGIYEASNTVMLYLGMVGAGLIASLGSNFIHEFIKILETVQTMKKEK